MSNSIGTWPSRKSSIIGPTTRRAAPDGGSIVTGGDDNFARVWEVPSGRPLGNPMIHPGAVSSVAYGHDGALIVTGSAAHAAWLWDFETGRPIGPPLPTDGPIAALGIGPRSRTVVVGDRSGNVQSWPIPEPMIDDPDRITLWLQVFTGYRSSGGSANVSIPGLIDGPRWSASRKALDAARGVSVP